jgi:uncharacterized protein
VYQRRDFYRHARYVHGWLSAFAFIALFFFSLTGLFLNHPDWFEASQDEQVQQISLPQNISETWMQQENPTESILSYVRQQHAVIGRYKSSEVMDSEVMIRLESPAGSTDIWAMLDMGELEVTTKPASTMTLIQDLHRGKNAGTSWSWFIDISAIVILLLSIAGFILFLTVKTRLLTHLLLTTASIAVLILLIWLAV